MKARNVSKNTWLVSNGRTASNFMERLRGLIGTAPLRPGEGLLLTGCRWIHTFGMDYPIDAVYFAEDGRVVGLSRSLWPGRIGPRMGEADHTLELPQGVIEDSQTEIGDIVEVSP